MNIEQASVLSTSVLYNVETAPLNKRVFNAYLTICSQLGSMIISDPNRAYDKFVQISKTTEQDAITEPNVIHAFYTPVCSVKVVCRFLFYYIVLTVTDNQLKPGWGIKSTRMLRLAFDATASGERWCMESKLEIRIDNNIEAVYQQEYDKRIHRENIKYLQKKGIKV